MTTSLAELSMDELAKAADVSRGTLYRIVPGKAALLQGLIEAYSPFEADPVDHRRPPRRSAGRRPAADRPDDRRRRRRAARADARDLPRGHVRLRSRRWRACARSSCRRSACSPSTSRGQMAAGRIRPDAPDPRAAGLHRADLLPPDDPPDHRADRRAADGPGGRRRRARRCRARGPRRRDGDRRRDDTDAAPAVEAIGLRKRFGKIHAVDGVDLALAPGRIYGLLGPNGSGKTTLIRMLAGLARATGGEARILGTKMPSRPTLARIGYMPQAEALYPELSVGENLGFFASLQGRRTARRSTACSTSSSCAIGRGRPRWSSPAACAAGSRSRARSCTSPR